MARSFSITPVRILGLKDGVSWYDSRDYPVQFYPPDETILIEDVVVSFPDFVHANAYGFAAGDTGGGVIRQSCSSYVSIPFQDWGPADQPGITNDLPNIVIGTMPGDADIALIRVNGTRTNTPDQILGNTVPTAFEEGQLVQMDGGTMLVEILFPIVRMMWIRFAATLNMDGTRNIILTRKQSIVKTAYTYWRSGNSPLNTGWTYGGTNGRYGHIAKLIEAKGPNIAPGGVITYRRGDGGQCSLTDTSDFSSDYLFDIEILPGRSNISSENSGGGSGLGATYFDLVETAELLLTATTHTFTDVYIGAAPESPNTRHVLVAITAFNTSDSTSRDMTGLTIGGVAATQLVYERYYFNNTGSNDSNFVAAYYLLEVPSGESTTVVASYSTNFRSAQIDVFSIYNLPSTTPVDTIDLSFGTATGVYNTQPTDVQAFGSLFSMFAAGFASATMDLRNIANVLNYLPDGGGISRWRGYEAISTTGVRNVEATYDSSLLAPWVGVSLQGRPGRAYQFSDSSSRSGLSDTATAFPDLNIGQPAKTNEKRYIVCIFSMNYVRTGTPDMGTVTVNGVSMTLLRKERTTVSGEAQIMAVYGVELTTSDTEGDFIFNYTGGQAREVMVDVYTMYNLLSLTPVDIEAAAANATSHSGSINGANFGFGIALTEVFGSGPTAPTLTVTGFQSVSDLLHSTDNGYYVRSFGIVNAGSVSVSMSSSYNQTKSIWMTFN